MLAEILILPLLAGAVIGTFLAFDALVPALAQALRSRAASCSTPRSPPRSTPRSTRMASRRLSAAALFAAAQIAFRSRKNARLLALCSVLVGMATSAAGTVAAIAQRLAVEGAYGQDALFGALLFMGAFLACAFALSATVLLMSRAASDARDDAERRSALRELGSSRAVEGRVLAMQNACYFGLPAVFGIAHSAAALTMLRTFSDYPTIGPALAADCATAAILATAAAASTARQLEDAKASRR
ncbi:MAG: hypothetical protein Q8M76_01975 [Spirochaetaceae bacterium]|nr:hypothetical protein [Spirochaetaceae bacterium]